MSHDSQDQQIRKFVAAFADGELDIEQTLDVLSRLSMDPATTARIDHQQKLREAVARVMTGPECRNNPTRCPELVKEEVRRLCRESPGPAADADATRPTGPAPPSPGSNATGGGSGSGPGVIARLSRWSPFAVAAIVAILAAAAFLSPSGIGVRPFDGSILEAAHAREFTHRHEHCTEDVTELMNHDAFPKEVGRLPEAVASHMGEPGKSPIPLDLRVLGYRYAGAGLCNVPGKPAVHVIYRGIDDAAAEALSLWITPDAGQLDELEPGRVYLAHMPEGKHRMMIWRHEGMAYYLLGNQMPDIESAVDVLWARGVKQAGRLLPWKGIAGPEGEAYAVMPRWADAGSPTERRP